MRPGHNRPDERRPDALMNPNASPPKPASPPRRPRVLRCVFLGACIFYVIALVAVGVFQRRFIYHPHVFATAQSDEMAREAQLQRWTNSAGATVGWKRLSPKQPSQGRVLVTYGNASYGVGCSRYADAIQMVAPFDVFILEYPGYADRAGSPSENSFYRAADETVPLLGTNVPVYLLGESLGTGLAAYLAGTYPDRFAGAILLSPYNRLSGVAQYQMPIFPAALLLVDRFPSEDYLRACFENEIMTLSPGV
jgi:hypothetical protein